MSKKATLKHTQLIHCIETLQGKVKSEICVFFFPTPVLMIMSSSTGFATIICTSLCKWHLNMSCGTQFNWTLCLKTLSVSYYDPSVIQQKVKFPPKLMTWAAFRNQSIIYIEMYKLLWQTIYIGYLSNRIPVHWVH